MNPRLNPLVRIVIIVVLSLLVLRLLPVFARVVQMAAVGLRSFVWIGLISALAIWGFWKLKQRRLNAQGRTSFRVRPALRIVDRGSVDDET